MANKLQLQLLKIINTLLATTKFNSWQQPWFLVDQINYIKIVHVQCTVCSTLTALQQYM